MTAEEGRWDYVEGEEPEQHYDEDELEKARMRMKGEKDTLDKEENLFHNSKKSMDYQEGGEKFKSRDQQEWYHATDQTFLDDEPHENRKVEGEAEGDDYIKQWEKDHEDGQSFDVDRYNKALDKVGIDPNKITNLAPDEWGQEEVNKCENCEREEDFLNDDGLCEDCEREQGIDRMESMRDAYEGGVGSGRKPEGGHTMIIKQKNLNDTHGYGVWGDADTSILKQWMSDQKDNPEQADNYQEVKKELERRGESYAKEEEDEGWGINWGDPEDTKKDIYDLGHPEEKDAEEGGVGSGRKPEGTTGGWKPLPEETGYMENPNYDPYSKDPNPLQTDPELNRMTEEAPDDIDSEIFGKADEDVSISVSGPPAGTQPPANMFDDEEAESPIGEAKATERIDDDLLLTLSLSASSEYPPNTSDRDTLLSLGLINSGGRPTPAGFQLIEDSRGQTGFDKRPDIINDFSYGTSDALNEAIATESVTSWWGGVGDTEFRRKALQAVNADLDYDFNDYWELPNDLQDDLFILYSEGFVGAEESNDAHEPAGSSTGGQFAKKDGGGDSGGKLSGMSEKDLIKSIKGGSKEWKDWGRNEKTEDAYAEIERRNKEIPTPKRPKGSGGSIFRDDPDAVSKMEAKVKYLQDVADYWKKVTKFPNRDYQNHDQLGDAKWYALSNNSANLRDAKKKLEGIKAQQARGTDLVRKTTYKSDQYGKSKPRFYYSEEPKETKSWSDIDTSDISDSDKKFAINFAKSKRNTKGVTAQDVMIRNARYGKLKDISDQVQADTGLKSGRDFYTRSGMSQYKKAVADKLGGNYDSIDKEMSEWLTDDNYHPMEQSTSELKAGIKDNEIEDLWDKSSRKERNDMMNYDTPDNEKSYDDLDGVHQSSLRAIYVGKKTGDEAQKSGYIGCPHCNQEFSNVQWLKDHIDDQHEGKESHARETDRDCDECGGDGYWDVPDRNSEDGLRQVPCEKCDDHDQYDTYDESKATEFFFTELFSKEGSQFHCNVCGKEFNSENDTINHLRDNHPNQVSQSESYAKETSYNYSDIGGEKRKITFTDNRGQTRTGNAVMKGPAGWVVNSGNEANPDLVDETNFISVESRAKEGQVSSDTWYTDYSEYWKKGDSYVRSGLTLSADIPSSWVGTEWDDLPADVQAKIRDAGYVTSYETYDKMSWKYLPRSLKAKLSEGFTPTSESGWETMNKKDRKDKLEEVNEAESYKKKASEVGSNPNPVTDDSYRQFIEPTEAPTGKTIVDQTYGVSEPETPDGQDLTGITVGEEENKLDFGDKDEEELEKISYGQEYDPSGEPDALDTDDDKVLDFFKQTGDEEIIEKIPPKIKYLYYKQYPFGRRAGKQNPFGESYAREISIDIMNKAHIWWDNKYPERQWSDMRIGDRQNVILAFLRDPDTRINESRATEFDSPLRDQHGNPYPTPEGIADCTFCGKVFDNWDVLGDHITIVHNDQGRTREFYGGNAPSSILNHPDWTGYAGEGGQGSGRKKEHPVDKAHIGWKNYGIDDYIDKAEKEYLEGNEWLNDPQEDIDIPRLRELEDKDRAGLATLEDRNEQVTLTRKYLDWTDPDKSQPYWTSLTKTEAKEFDPSLLVDMAPWESIGKLAFDTAKDIMFPAKAEEEEGEYFSEDELDAINNRGWNISDVRRQRKHEPWFKKLSEGGLGSGKKDHKSWMRAIEEEQEYNFCDKCSMITEQVNHKCQMCGKKV